MTFFRLPVCTRDKSSLTSISHHTASDTAFSGEDAIRKTVCQAVTRRMEKTNPLSGLEVYVNHLKVCSSTWSRSPTSRPTTATRSMNEIALVSSVKQAAAIQADTFPTRRSASDCNSCPLPTIVWCLRVCRGR